MHGGRRRRNMEELVDRVTNIILEGQLRLIDEVRPGLVSAAHGDRVTEFADDAVYHVYNTKPAVRYYNRPPQPHPTVCLVSVVTLANGDAPADLAFFASWLVV